MLSCGYHRASDEIEERMRDEKVLNCALSMIVDRSLLGPRNQSART